MSFMSSSGPNALVWPRHKAGNGILQNSINADDYKSIQDRIASVRGQLFRQDATVQCLACRWSEKDLLDPHPIFSAEDLGSYLAIPHADQPSPILITHLFIIDQLNTKSCLNITEEGMCTLLDRINASPQLGNALVAFAGAEAPVFEGRSDFYSRKPSSPSAKNSAFELCMVLKYVELNGNKSNTIPWSIRQQLFHQIFEPNNNRNSMLLIRASLALKRRIQEVFQGSLQQSAHWTDVVILVVSTLTNGWSEYAGFLDRAAWNVGTSTSFTNPFRQSLGEADFKTLQDTHAYQDLLTRAIHVLQSNIHILELLYKDTAKRRRLERGAHQAEYNLLNVTIEHVKEQLNTTVQHLLLIQARLNRITEGIRDCIALRSSQQSVLEAKNMRKLALSANREARTVKAIALVTLVYLPASFVATFLGMGYVNVTGGRLGSVIDVSIQPTLWMFLALTVPLTVITLLAWWLWEFWNRRKNNQSPEGKDVMV